MSRILVVGATSAIAEACLRRWAARGEQLCLAARDATRLDAIAADLRIRGAASVQVLAFDAADRAAQDALVAQATAQLGGLDAVLVAHGSLPDQARCQAEPDLARREIEVNALSVIAIAGSAANLMEAQGGGVIGIIGSVAGDRGRQSNYVYGAAKALVDRYAEGLRHRLFRRGVRVVLLKPGFVDTPMTAHLAKGPLWAQPADIAPRIVRALDRDNGSVYVPGIWRLIMLVIRHLPPALFLRSRL